MKTSIKFKKIWFAHPTAGGVGTDWEEMQSGVREGTAQINGSSADVTNYPNVEGKYLERGKKTGEITVNMQLADLSPALIAEFTGGTITTTADYVLFEAPSNPNQVIELSIKILSEKGILYTLPRCAFDAFPMLNDDDLHYYTLESVVLSPEDNVTPVYSYYNLIDESLTDIVTFDFEEATLTGTVDTAAHTVAIEVVNGTVVTALVPSIIVDPGAFVSSPLSGVAADFTAPVPYTVTAADGTTQIWTVTVTIATPPQ